MNIVQLLISLSILVFIHELGHFSMARLFGARVEKFYLFFNPWFSLLKYQSKRSGTIYGLGWLPLGGYCQIAGMVDESMDTEALKSEPKPDEFRSKPALQRLLIMAGGIIFNLILAFILYCGISYIWGTKHLDGADVKAGWAFSEAAKSVGFQDGDIILSIDGEEHHNALDNRFLSYAIEAKKVEVLRNGNRQMLSIPRDLMERLLAEGKGFASMQVPFIVDSVLSTGVAKGVMQAGDEVTAINGQFMPDATDVLEALATHKGQDVHIAFMRSGIPIDTTLRLDTAGRLGVILRSPADIYPVKHIEYSILGVIPAGLDRAVGTISSYVSGLKYIFTKEGAKSLGGLGTMAKLFPTSFDWYAFWMTTAFLSVILAVMNLLPIPALDGGHILFILIEMITRRKLSDKAMGYIQMAGMIFLLLLMLYANGNDIYRYLIK